MEGRRVEVKLKIKKGDKEYDVSEDFSPFIESVNWTDNMSDKADDLTLKLEDRSGIWIESWLPTQEGYLMEMEIETLDRIYPESPVELHKAGIFEIDEVTCKPNEAEIRAVSIVGNTSLRNEKRNQTWEKVELRGISEEIAKRNNLKLFWDCDENPKVDHIEQDEQADLEFLQKLCHDNGLSMKITPEQLIIFDEYKYEQEEPKITVYRPGYNGSYNTNTLRLTWLTEWDFKQKSRDTYDKCEVQCAKGKKKEVIEGSYQVGTGAKVLKVKQQVDNKEEAERLSKKKLRDANKDKTTGSFGTIGNMNLRAGNTVEMRGFGKFDGRYLMTKVSHTISGANFKTKVEVRKCLDGY